MIKATRSFKSLLAILFSTRRLLLWGLPLISRKKNRTQINTDFQTLINADIIDIILNPRCKASALIALARVQNGH